MCIYKESVWDLHVLTNISMMRIFNKEQPRTEEGYQCDGAL